MLFSINQTCADGNSVVKIIGASENNQIDSIVSALNMISNATLFLKFANQYGLKLALCPGDSKISIITNSDASFTNVTSVYSTIDKYLTDNNIEQLPNVISQKLIAALTQMPDVTDAIAVTIVSLCLTFRSYLRDSADDIDLISIGMDYYAPKYFEQTKQFIDSLNESAIWPFTKISMSENKTIPMKSCDDQLFVEIPSRQLLLDDDVNVKSFLPKKSSFYRPYGAATLNDMTLYKEPESKFPKELIPMVEGNVHNNELGIQENEQKYYDALIEWVQFNMKSDAGTDIDVSPSNPNIDAVSQVYLDALCEMFYGWNWDHNPNIPVYDADADEPEYNDDAADDGIKSSYVYKATKKEKAAMEAGVDLNSVHEMHVNAFELLKDYLREASLNLGYKVYVEAVIKLARWGERKPTALFFEDYPLIFSLGDNKVSQYIGYIDSYEVKQQNGCDSTAICAIYDNAMFADKGYLRSLGYEYDCLMAPIGLFGQKIYVNKSDLGPEELKFEQYYSLIDVVRSYVTGSEEFKIDGIEYDGTSFKTTKNIVCDDGIVLSKIMFQYKANKNNMMLSPFCSAESLQNLYMDLGVVLGAADAPLHHFTLLQSKQRVADLRKDISINSFSSKEDLLKKREERAIRLLRYAVETEVASVILPVYIIASKLYEEKPESERTFENILNIYKEAMIRCDYFDEAGFMQHYNRIGDCKSIREACGVNEVAADSPVQSMNLFGNSVETNKGEANSVQSTMNDVQNEKMSDHTENVEKSSTNINTNPDVMDTAKSMSFIKPVNSNDIFYRLTDGSGNTIGGCAVRDMTVMFHGVARKRKMYVFVNDKTFQSVPQEKIIKTHMFKQVVGLIIDDLLVYESGHYERISTYFNDLETIKYYRDTTKSLLDNNNM